MEGKTCGREWRRLTAALLLLLPCAGAQVGRGGGSPTAPSLWIGPWTRASAEPVIRPDVGAVFADPVSGGEVRWEALHTFNPAAVVRDGKVWVLYRAEDDSGAKAIGGHVSRLGLAVSEDGVHFVQRPQPVFYPAKDAEESREVPGGVEDPRVVEGPDGGYVLTYTQWSRTRGSYSVGIATSHDLEHWTKMGPAFAGSLGGRYDALKYKSAGIVTEVRGGRLVAAKIGGSYWMYWGEIEVGLARSTDLVHWTPVETAAGKPLVLLRSRAGKADSGFPETGPPPVRTARGIVMLYNAKNADGAAGDRRLQAGTYTVEEALFDRDDPAKLVGRTAEPVFAPELPFERSGQYAAGTTFAEGLVLFRGRWWMYYGCADSFVGVATAPF
ncbi:MAG: glycoside hydrolase family 130 protein [Acidobacteriota bacterium]|nr:glycoside hydrolase family 130 protein [Acidobacteriota bacterium]